GLPAEALQQQPLPPGHERVRLGQVLPGEKREEHADVAGEVVADEGALLGGGEGGEDGLGVAVEEAGGAEGEGPCRRPVAPLVEEEGEVVEGGGDGDVLGPEGGLPHGEGAAVERL